MKAIVLEQPGQFRHADVPEPCAPGEGEALVRVHRVGICGTDISGYLGKMPFFSYPRIPGHELGVEVLAVGPGVVNVQPGDRCSVEPYINCQTCPPCHKGFGNCCENLKVLGVMTDGGLRERFVLPARKLHVSRKLSFEQLALIETLAIGCHCVDRAAPTAGMNVLVIGAGPIGLSVLEFLKLAGAKTTVLDLSESRLAFCRDTMGVAHTVGATDMEGDLKQFRDLTGGELFPVVIDATGSAACMSQALNYVAFAGRLVYVGITTGQVAFVHPLLHRKEMTLMGSRNAHPGDFARIIRHIEEGHIDTRPWITHRCPFDELSDRFEAYTKPETGAIKAVVEVV